MRRLAREGPQAAARFPDTGCGYPSARFHSRSFAVPVRSWVDAHAVEGLFSPCSRCRCRCSRALGFPDSHPRLPSINRYGQVVAPGLVPEGRGAVPKFATKQPNSPKPTSRLPIGSRCLYSSLAMPEFAAKAPKSENPNRGGGHALCSSPFLPQRPREEPP